MNFVVAHIHPNSFFFVFRLGHAPHSAQTLLREAHSSCMPRYTILRTPAAPQLYILLPKSGEIPHYNPRANCKRCAIVIASMQRKQLFFFNSCQRPKNLTHTMFTLYIMYILYVKLDYIMVFF